MLKVCSHLGSSRSSGLIVGSEFTWVVVRLMHPSGTVVGAIATKAQTTVVTAAATNAVSSPLFPSFSRLSSSSRTWQTH